MALPFELENGERVVWQSKAGGVAGYSQWVGLLALPAMLPILGLMGSIPFLLFGGNVAKQLLGIGSNLLCLSPFLALFVVAWVIPRRRTSFYLTNRALVARKILGGLQRIPLSSITAAEQYVMVRQGRYGPRHIKTHRARLQVQEGQKVLQEEFFGPSLQIGRMLDLLEHAVFGNWINLEMLPAVVGAAPPAETHESFFIASQTREDGFDYGPLFVGPTRIYRFTEELPAHLLGRLYTVLGESFEADDAEAQVARFLEYPEVGHYLDLPREGARFTFDGPKLTIQAGETTRSVELHTSDANRLRAVLKRSQV